ncbi:MAG: hypothetical protein GWP44_01420 [Proteobacteria bacterium]|nr:hypothetical protein [Pseudomonadota bacterium]
MAACNCRPDPPERRNPWLAKRRNKSTCLSWCGRPPRGARNTCHPHREEMLNGRAYSDALRKAQDIGVAEAGPSLDVGGWDTAAKLVIAANTIRFPQTVRA